MGDGVGDLAFWIAVAVASAGFWSAMTPIAKAFARRIDGSAGTSEKRLAELEARLDGMEHRALTSGEVDNQFVRLTELEERMEFAERLLTRQATLPASEETP